jgi:hypothetical protein
MGAENPPTVEELARQLVALDDGLIFAVRVLEDVYWGRPDTVAFTLRKLRQIHAEAKAVRDRLPRPLYPPIPHVDERLIQRL